MRAGLLICCLLLAACARQDPEHPRVIAAWWIEDVSRGIARRPAELHRIPEDPDLRRLADWAGASDVPPAQLAARSRRWDQIRALFATGDAVLPPADSPAGRAGLIAPRPGLSVEIAEQVAPVVDAENRDRRIIAAIAGERLRVVPAEASAWMATLAEVRRNADAAAGAQVWNSR
jgi:hypothetical protein